jgi:hypothetical protein
MSDQLGSRHKVTGALRRQLRRVQHSGVQRVVVRGLNLVRSKLVVRFILGHDMFLGLFRQKS